MSAAHALAAARHERSVARQLGTVRTARRGDRRPRPDVAVVQTPAGDRLCTECKLRRRLPRLIVDGLAQAQRYAPGAIPMVVLRERGGTRDLVCVDLRHLCRWLGIDAGALPTRHRPTRRAADARQVDMFDGGGGE